MNTQNIKLRKIAYSDGSIGRYMVIQQDAILTEIKLKAYQYKQLKDTGLFNVIESAAKESVKAYLNK